MLPTPEKIAHQVSLEVGSQLEGLLAAEKMRNSFSIFKNKTKI